MSTRLIAHEKMARLREVAASARPLSLGQLTDLVAQYTENFAQPVSIRIAESAVGVLDGARKEDGVMGAVWRGELWLFREEIHSVSDLQMTFFHELFHLGLQRMFSVREYVKRMHELYDADAWIRDFADQWTKSANGVVTEAQQGKAFARARGVDDALAHLAEVIGPSGRPFRQQGPVATALRTVVRWCAGIASALKLPHVAARIRGWTSEDARMFVCDVFLNLASKQTAGALHRKTRSRACSSSAANGVTSTRDSTERDGVDALTLKRLRV